MVPRLGKVIVYDALAHASTHEGVNRSLAIAPKEFAHNDYGVFSQHATFYSQLLAISEAVRAIHLVAVESVCSMDDDACPLQELVDVAKESFPSESGVV